MPILQCIARGATPIERASRHSDDIAVSAPNDALEESNTTGAVHHMDVGAKVFERHARLSSGGFTLLFIRLCCLPDSVTCAEATEGVLAIHVTLGEDLATKTWRAIGDTARGAADNNAQTAVYASTPYTTGYPWQCADRVENEPGGKYGDISSAAPGLRFAGAMIYRRCHTEFGCTCIWQSSTYAVARSATLAVARCSWTAELELFGDKRSTSRAPKCLPTQPLEPFGRSCWPLCAWHAEMKFWAFWTSRPRNLLHCDRQSRAVADRVDERRLYHAVIEESRCGAGSRALGCPPPPLRPVPLRRQPVRGARRKLRAWRMNRGGVLFCDVCSTLAESVHSQQFGVRIFAFGYSRVPQMRSCGRAIVIARPQSRRPTSLRRSDAG